MWRIEGGFDEWEVVDAYWEDLKYDNAEGSWIEREDDDDSLDI